MTSTASPEATPRRRRLGARAATEHVFRTADGRRLTLLHVDREVDHGVDHVVDHGIDHERTPRKGPVLLVHGAGVRAHIFAAPVATTVVDALVEAGYDVWLENWRASIDVPASEWTLDEAAAFDHPAAVDEVLRLTGAETLQAVVHCQGSTSFVLSAVAGLLPRVTTVVSNAVSLHPVVPRISAVKGRWAVPLIARLTPYMDPQWGRDVPGAVPTLFRRAVRLTHHECTNDVCRMVSFTYGTGFPTLWSHDTISDATHDWLSDEFAAVPVSFFQQMNRCIRRGHLVTTGRFAELPSSTVAAPPATDARFVFLAGADNRCFLPEGQVRSFEFFDAHRPDVHSLHVLEGYGHLDVFMGDGAATDVFPIIVEELE